MRRCKRKESVSSMGTQNNIDDDIRENHILNISGIAHESVVDGPGIRMTVFTQGCIHNCEGCHNKNTHEFGIGRNVTVSEILNEYKEIPLYDGITISGGEPFCQPHQIAELAKGAKSIGANVIIYTGFHWEDIMSNEDFRKVLTYTDFLVDGPFIESKKSYDLKFKGSSNQRIIDVQASLYQHILVLANL
jgi:anaerobic ribonucleoside-triphosphate reductase activating protein